MSEASSPQSESLNVSTTLSTASRASSISPTIQINGKEYEMVELTVNKRGKTSWVWKEGFKLVDLSSSKRSWMCRRCYEEGTTVIYASNSTSHLINHLRDIHYITQDGPINPDNTQFSSGNSLAQSVFDFQHFKDLLI